MKTILKRTVAVIAIAALSVTMLAGCNKQVSDKNEQGQTIVTVGSWPDKEGPDLEAILKREAQFEANNPDIAIEPDYWAFDVKTFYPKAAGGQLPTVYHTHYTEIPQIIDSGYAADLTDALSKRGYDGMFNEKILDIVSKDDRIYAYPYASYVLGLAYNTKLFEKAGLMEADGTPKQPKTWDEVAEFAKKIKDATGTPGIVFNTANNAGGWIFTCVAWSFGVDFMEKDENGKWKATFNTPEAAAALQWYKDLRWKYDVLPSNSLIDNAEAQKLLALGNAAMYVTAGDIAGKMDKYDMNPDDLGIMAMPAGPKRHVTLLGGSVYEVPHSATEAQIDGAIRWIETMYNHQLSDEYKTNKERDIQDRLAKGQLVGIKGMSPWSSKSEGYQFESELIDKYANSNPNHVRLYNEFVADCPADIQPEEPVCCQELYQTLDGCIQEVLVNENADPVKLLEKANADFQSNYLDNISY